MNNEKNDQFEVWGMNSPSVASAIFGFWLLPAFQSYDLFRSGNNREALFSAFWAIAVFSVGVLCGLFRDLSNDWLSIAVSAGAQFLVLIVWFFLLGKRTPILIAERLKVRLVVREWWKTIIFAFASFILVQVGFYVVGRFVESLRVQ